MLAGQSGYNQEKGTDSSKTHDERSNYDKGIVSAIVGTEKGHLPQT